MLHQALEYGRGRNYRKAAAILERIVGETDDIPEALLYLGRSYHALGEYGRAVPILRSYISAEPGSDAGYFFLGRSYMSLGQYPQAVLTLRKALEVNPDSDAAVMYLGYAYLKYGNTAAALSFLEKAVDMRPEDKRLYNGYLNTLLIQGIKEFQRGSLDKALSMLSLCHSLGGDSLLLHLYLGILERETGSIERAVKHYDRAVSVRPGDPSIRFQRAETLFLAGRQDEALQDIENLLKESEEEITLENIHSLHRMLAVHLFQNEQFRRAIYYAVKVLKDGPDPDMHLLIGEGYRNLGDRTKAGNHYLRARKYLPDSAEPLYGLALLCWESGDWQGMLDHLAVLERLHPGDDISSYYRALCFSKLQKPPEETLPVILAELNKSGPDPFLFTALGMDYLRTSEPSRAEEYFFQALELKPGFAEAYHGLIRFYERTGDDKKLLKILEHYLDDEPGDRAAEKKRIKILLQAGMYKQVLGPLETFLSHDPKDSSAQRALAFCLRETKQYRRAAVWYRRLLAAEPEKEVYLRSLIYCLRACGRTCEAIILLEKAIDFYKQPSSTIITLLSDLYRAEGRLDDATRTAHRALDVDPAQCAALRGLAEMYRDKGIEEFALRYAQKAKDCFKKSSCDSTIL